MKLLFGVNGEGWGHAARSKVIISELEKDHDIKVVGGGKAYSFLSKFFDVSRIGFFKIIYRNNSVSYFLTCLYNLVKFPFIFLYNLKLFFIMLRFKPDAVITDFEPFSCCYALIFNKKCISIDNQHIINTDLKRNIFFEKLLVNLMVPRANYYLITTFFYPKIFKKNTYLFPPINKKEIIGADSKQKDYVLVYQTSKSNKKLISILQSIDNEFVVYGFDKNSKVGNVELKKFNEKEFNKDLINCKAVITNGGFTLIGEALYLHKPILSIPVNKQFEQMINALYLEKLGYGKYCKKTTKDNIVDFLSNLSKYKDNLKKYGQKDNSEIFKKLKKILDS